jgi:hypothetical protein
MTVLVQGVLGISGLVWAAFLLPRTSFVAWIAANLLYGILALTASELFRRRNPQSARMVAILALFIFLAANSAVASLACRSNGACSQILLVTVIIAASQLAVIAFGS